MAACHVARVGYSYPLYVADASLTVRMKRDEVVGRKQEPKTHGPETPFEIGTNVPKTVEMHSKQTEPLRFPRLLRTTIDL